MNTQLQHLPHETLLEMEHVYWTDYENKVAQLLRQIDKKADVNRIRWQQDRVQTAFNRWSDVQLELKGEAK